MKTKVLFVSIMITSLLIMDLHAQVTYQVGQVYEIDGVKGLVYQTTKNGRHGMMMSLEEIDQVQFIKNKKYLSVLCASDTSDGMKNMKSIEKLIADENLSWEDFPMFKCAKDMGEGWYIPSYYETRELIEALTGGTFKNSMINGDKKKAKEISEILKDNGGDPLSLTMVCATDIILKNKKGKQFYYVYCFAVPKSSASGFLTAALIDNANKFNTKLLLYNKKTKFTKGTRAIRKF